MNPNLVQGREGGKKDEKFPSNFAMDFQVTNKKPSSDQWTAWDFPPVTPLFYSSKTPQSKV